MKKVLILAGISDNGRSTPYEKYLKEYIKDYDFRQIYLDQLYISVRPGKFEIYNAHDNAPIHDHDLVMIREYSGQFLDLAFVIAKYFQAHKKPFFNENYLIYRPISKIAQAVRFYEQGVDFPATYYSLSGETLIEKAKSLGFPMILKDRLGMHGSSNYLVNSETEALDIVRQNSHIKFIAQEYLPNDHDYRVLVMGGHQPVQIKRTAAGGSHLNNTSQGGKGELVDELPKKILSESRELAQAFSIDVGGVDVVQRKTDGRYFFLEINNQPQLATGAEVPAKMKMFKEYLDGYLSEDDPRE